MRKRTSGVKPVKTGLETGLEIVGPWPPQLYTDRRQAVGTYEITKVEMATLRKRHLLCPVTKFAVQMI